MSDAEAIVELIEGFQRFQTLVAAVRLGIFEGERPQAAELERLLEACASLGLLERRDTEYVNTTLSDKYLRGSSPLSLAGFVKFAGASLYPRWGELDEAVIEGTQRENPLSIRGTLRRGYRRLKGARARQDTNRDFNAGMHGLGMLSSPAVAAAFDLSSFRSCVDLGGATGHLALAIAERYPHMKIGVFELPHVIPISREYTFGKATLYPGDLLTDALPAADLYALGKVLHNKDESGCRLLLKRVYDALSELGALLVAERVLNDDRSGPAHVHMSSLNMLVATSGRERTFSEYRGLLLGVGFSDVRFKRTGCLVDAILATK